MIKVNDQVFVQNIEDSLQKTIVTAEDAEHFILEDGSKFKKTTLKQVGNRFNHLVEISPESEQEYLRQLKKP